MFKTPLTLEIVGCRIRPIRGGNCQNVYLIVGGNIVCMDKNTPWNIIGLPNGGSTIGPAV